MPTDYPLTLLQLGYSPILGGWNEDFPAVGVELDRVVGMRFSVAGILGPMRLDFDLTSLRSDTQTMQVYCQLNQPAFPAFSAANPALQAGTVVGTTALLPAGPDTYPVSVALNIDLLATLMSNPAYNTELALTLTTDSLTDITSVRNFELSYELRDAVPPDVTADSPTVPAIYEDQGAIRRYACPRCGWVTPRAELVEDAYTHAWVCRQCFDPADPMEAPPKLTSGEEQPDWEVG